MPGIQASTTTFPTPGTQPIKGNVYYVAGDDLQANDDNNGLFPEYQGEQEGPWKTIRHSAAVMQAGDTTYVRAGTYQEAGVVFANSGVPGKWITLANYAGEEPVMDGSSITDALPGIGITGSGGYIMIQGLIIQNMPSSGIVTDDNTTTPHQEISIRDCTLSGNGRLDEYGSGISLSAVEGFVVANVESHDNAYYGLVVGSSRDGSLSSAGGIIQDSRFYNHTGTEGHGLAINQGHDILVKDNVAFHNRIHGIDLSDWPKEGEVSHDITLEGNQSYDNGVAGFSVNSDSNHIRYQRNIAWGNGAKWAGHGTSSGFLCYNGCWHVEWLNNVAVGNSDCGFRVDDHPGVYTPNADSQLVFHNNIGYMNGKSEWNERPALVVSESGWQITATYNNWGGEAGKNAPVVGLGEGGTMTAYTSDQINQSAFQEHNLSVDPLFVDLSGLNWRLQPGSPMIDAGMDVGLSFCGSAPDLGAIEFCP